MSGDNENSQSIFYRDTGDVDQDLLMRSEQEEFGLYLGDKTEGHIDELGW